MSIFDDLGTQRRVVQPLQPGSCWIAWEPDALPSPCLPQTVSKASSRFRSRPSSLFLDKSPPQTLSFCFSGCFRNSVWSCGRLPSYIGASWAHWNVEYRTAQFLLMENIKIAVWGSLTGVCSRRRENYSIHRANVEAMFTSGAARRSRGTPRPLSSLKSSATEGSRVQSNQTLISTRVHYQVAGAGYTRQIAKGLRNTRTTTIIVLDDPQRI